MAARKPSLRAVKSGEKAEPAAPAVLSLADAVATGDYYTILLAQRREIALSIPDEKGPAKAALHRQLSLIAKELEVIEVRMAEEAKATSDAEVEDGEFDASAV